MDLTIRPAKLKGVVTPPGSKSLAHRAVLALALSKGRGKLSNLPPSQDIQATRDCVEALKEEREGLPLLPCRESGSTLRFVIPIALVLRGGGIFTGRGRLMERPQKPYEDLFRQRGILWRQERDRLVVQGTLRPGIFALPGHVSSQFVTGLLYALPLLEGDSAIVITSPLESRGYVELTLDMLEKFGIRVENRAWTGFEVPGGQQYRARDLTIEGDWSQAAFWYAANGMGSQVEVRGLNPDSVQGDRVCLDLMARLDVAGDEVLDVSQCPDLVPPLALRAALRKGEHTRMVNAGRLRIKESDRLHTVTETLNALGARVAEHEDSLDFYGVDSLQGGVAVDCCNDHRIAMMAGIAATCCDRKVTLLGADCVSKSYPEFWEHYRMLGGETDGVL